MSGYNKVDDNTFVNIVPFLTGNFVFELGWNEMMRNKEFDDYQFIWHNFTRAGYTWGLLSESLQEGNGV